MSTENSFSDFFKNNFSVKNIALGAVLIACPIIGIPYGASLLLKNNNDEQSNKYTNDYYENEKLKKD